LQEGLRQTRVQDAENSGLQEQLGQREEAAGNAGFLNMSSTHSSAGSAKQEDPWLRVWAQKGHRSPPLMGAKLLGFVSMYFRGKLLLL